MTWRNKPPQVFPGDVFGYMTIVKFSHHDKRWRRHYLCRCKCGIEKTVQGTLLRVGNTKSCGCFGREVRRTLNKLPNDGGVINHIILQYKRHARARGIEWLLDRADVDRLVRLPCRYCGESAGNLKKTKNCKGGFPHNGIDRLNPARPYTKDNVAPCCGFCNRAKQSLTLAEFLAWARRIADHQRAMAEQWG